MTSKITIEDATSRSTWDKFITSHKEANFLQSWDFYEFHASRGKTVVRRVAKENGFIMMHRERMFFDSFYISILSEREMGHRFAFIRGFFVGLRSWWVSLANKDKCSSLIYAFRKQTF